jgi:hypothetical protein
MKHEDGQTERHDLATLLSFYDLCQNEKRMKSIFLAFQFGLNPRFIHFLFSQTSGIRFIKSRVAAHGRHMDGTWGIYEFFELQTNICKCETKSLLTVRSLET